jgi:hypothetical protein
MADYTPPFPGGNKPRTYTAGAAITGGQVVVVSAADTVIPGSAASAAAVGVAAHDAANGAAVTVWPLAGVTHELIASAAIAVGDNVTTAATGQVATVAQAAGTTMFSQIIGVALTVASAGGQKIQVLGR